MKLSRHSLWIAVVLPWCEATVASSKSSAGEPVMEESSAALSQDVAHLVVGSTLLSYFSIMDLMCLSCTSKALRQLCKTELSKGSKQLAHELVCRASKDAAAAAYGEELTPSREPGKTPWRSLPQLCKGVEWLLNTSGIELFGISDANTAHTVQTLLHTCNMPPPLAQVLLAAGLHVGYEQLVIPARSGVRGLSVWKVALRERQLPVIFPQVSECLCHSSMPELLHSMICRTAISA